jgi:hypothetical protein
MVRRCNLAEVEGDGVASLCEFGYLGGALGGFIYAASLGLQVFLAFYSKSKCWALRASCILRAGFFLDINQVDQYRGLRGHTLVISL